MSFRTYGLIATTLSFFSLLAITLIISSREKPVAIIYSDENAEEGLPVLGSVTDFDFTDSAGKAFGSADMTGKIWVADFIFTSCAGICPVMTGNMGTLQKEFADYDNLHFVSFSVDPETDTPEVLQAYGEKHDAEFASWHFLTAPEEAILDLSVNGFKVGSMEDPVFHSPRFVLVDGEGRIRGYYDGTLDEDVDELRVDLATLLNE